MFSRPRILLACNREGKTFTKELKVLLRDWADADIWSGIFDLSEITLSALESRLPKLDLCVFLWISDLKGSEIELQKAKDSLNFELGFSRKFLDKNNILIVAENDSSIISEVVSDLESVAFSIFEKPISTELISNNIKEHFHKNVLAPPIERDIHPKPVLPKMIRRSNYYDFGDNSQPIARYSFPKKYSSTNEEYEFALIELEGKVYISDQGRTIKMLDKLFELKEPDVRKNIDAIVKRCDVIKFGDELRIEIKSWKDNPKLENDEVYEKVYRLFSCVVFMDTMQIFYV